ncbi:MAG: hypothetical protein ACREQ9_27225 [Candidatus Binatia bacterium]
MNHFIACFFAFAEVFAACTAVVPLEKRVASYWKAREARDFGASYELEDPRGGIDKTAYIQKMSTGNVEYRSFRIEEIREEGDEAKVVLKLVYRIPMVPKNVEGSLTDVWFRVGRHWYHRNPVANVTSENAAGTAR